ncbi:flagellar biosynthesis protein FlhB [Candidatus Gottesmanbacteria bacterium]|nr:flagellar biosynthesis protein FlhB [Candidatus Gottesmanbacteria bacterium]
MKYYTRKIDPGQSTQQKAAALKYNEQLNLAPVVKAKGKGFVAEKIIQIAQDNNIPIREDAELVEILVQIDLEKEIPPELYKIVAEIFAFVYKLNNSKKARNL